MILEKLTYSFHFHGTDAEEFRPCKEDVFYLSKGKKYRQFYKGQLIPKEIFDSLFEKEEVQEATLEVEEVSSTEEELVLTEETTKESPTDEVKPQKKKRKTSKKK